MFSKHMTARIFFSTPIILSFGCNFFKKKALEPKVPEDTSLRKFYDETNNRLVQACGKESEVYNRILLNLNRLFFSLSNNADNNANASELASRKIALISALVIMGWMQAIVEQHKISGDALFQGAHVVIDDPDSSFLESIKACCEKNGIPLVRRYSSHYKHEKIRELLLKGYSQSDAEKLFNQGRPDYSVRAEAVFPELCFGQFFENGKKHTWLQHEAHSHQERSFYDDVSLYILNSAIKFIAHKTGFEYNLERLLHDVRDFFFIYLLFYRKQRNVGPYGTSPMTEKKSPIEISQVAISDEVVNCKNIEMSI